MGDDVIYFLHQNAFAIHFFDYTCWHFALAEPFDVCLAGIFFHLFFHLGQVVALGQLNFDKAISGALFV
jgi:hypothetical protein